MPYSIGFGKLERGVLSNEALPPDVRIAIIAFKNAIRSGHRPRPFDNDPAVLPSVGAGQSYYEWQVGQATAATPEFPSLAGRRRLVALVDPANQILKLYFSDEHYRVGSWRQLQYP